MALFSTSSSKTPPTTARALFNRSGGETCYFPNCRKDANCNCEICIESFNATKDLHSALTFPTKKRKKRIFKSSPPSTLETISSVSSLDQSPPLISTAKSQPKKRVKKRNKDNGFSITGYFFTSLLFVGVLLILGVKSGAFKRFGPKLKYEIVKGFIEEDNNTSDRSIKLKLETLEKKLVGIVGNNGGVRKCSLLDSIWKLNQDGGNRLMYQWRCVIYKSVAEELSVWGSPLHTSGFLMAGISSRSLTLLSGKITELSQGKLVAVSRKSNERSWKLLRFTAAAVHLENETWVLEYSRNALLDHPGLNQKNVWMIVKELGRQMLAKPRNLMHAFSDWKEGKQIVTPT